MRSHRTTSLYAPPECRHGDRIVLPADEARHAAKVLRLKPGDTIDVVDGHGSWYIVDIEAVSKRDVMGQIVGTEAEVGEPSYKLTMAVAPLRHASRFETFVEKAAELGVYRIMPIASERTHRAKWKPDRLFNISVAAMKQCGRSRLTEILAPMDFETAIAEAGKKPAFICHEAVEADSTFLNHLTKASDELTVFVGPEGGFSEDEVESAFAAGIRPVSLGPRRLRAETAAITAAALVMAQNATG